MKRLFAEFKFYQTYYFAQAITDILHDQFAYIRHLNDFYGEGRAYYYFKPFSKYSVFHEFIEFVVRDIIHDTNSEVDLEKRKERIKSVGKYAEAFGWIPEHLPINLAFDFYEIEHLTFNDWLRDNGSSFSDANDDDICEYLDELILNGDYDKLIEKIVHEVFFILFQNRQLLLTFNEMISRQLDSCDVEEIPDDCAGYFSKLGRVKRVSIPSWVKRAVYFRDRGICVLCNRDLSGVLNISNRENLTIWFQSQNSA